MELPEIDRVEQIWSEREKWLRSKREQNGPLPEFDLLPDLTRCSKRHVTITVERKTFDARFQKYCTRENLDSDLKCKQVL